VGVRNTAFVMATAQSGPRRHAAASNRVAPASRQGRRRGTNWAGASIVNLGNFGLALPEQRDEAQCVRNGFRAYRICSSDRGRGCQEASAGRRECIGCSVRRKARSALLLGRRGSSGMLHPRGRMNKNNIVSRWYHEEA
jgi:hypothetical protein